MGSSKPRASYSSTVTDCISKCGTSFLNSLSVILTAVGLSSPSDCPVKCEVLFDPVCGSNRQTYKTTCHLKRYNCFEKLREKVIVVHKGECLAMEDDETEPHKWVKSNLCLVVFCSNCSCIAAVAIGLCELTIGLQSVYTATHRCLLSWCGPWHASLVCHIMDRSKFFQGLLVPKWVSIQSCNPVASIHFLLYARIGR